MSNMYVVIQHQNGRVGHQSIPRDFDAKWFDPVDCISTIDSLLESRARCVAKGVRTELALLRRVLTEVAHRGSTFHLVEVESEEEIGCEKILLME